MTDAMKKCQRCNLPIILSTILTGPDLRVIWVHSGGLGNLMDPHNAVAPTDEKG